MNYFNCRLRRRLRTRRILLTTVIILTLASIVTVQMHLSTVEKPRLLEQILVFLVPRSSIVEVPSLATVSNGEGTMATATKMSVETTRNQATRLKSSLFINAEIWQEFCSLNFNSPRQHPLFPWKPSKSFNISVGDTLRLSNNGEGWFVMRIMGYFHPPLTGDYKFQIKSNSMAKLCLQTNQNSKSLSNLTNVATARKSLHKRTITITKGTPTSPTAKLYKENRYYFEIWLAVNNPLPKNNESTFIQWKLPNSDDYEDISNKCFSPLDSTNSYINNFHQMLKETPSTLRFSDEEDRLTGQHFPLDKNTTVNKRVEVNIDKAREMLKCVSPRRLRYKEIRVLPYFDRVMLNEAFPKCLYEPSYMKKRKYQRYQAVWHIRYPVAYPYDGSWNVRWGAPYKSQFNLDDRFDGTTFMQDNEAIHVVQKFMESLKGRHPQENIQLVDVTNIEKVTDGNHGDRFFLELVLTDRRNTSYRISQFFFLKPKAPQLCILENLRWESKVWVNVILNVKKQGAWILYFISEMARVLRETGDENVNFIIADYGNDDVDIGQEMKRQGIKHYQVFKKTGLFHKTSSINMAASKVVDPNSIVLLMDLHLQFPVNFFEKARQHTIQGKLAFAPILFRLDKCGRPQTKHVTPSGFWESLGFGIFSIYKSDWDRFGGMNEKEFKNKWGGEDWEMVDRVLGHGIEVDKIRTLGLYHFFHPKKGLWS